MKTTNKIQFYAFIITILFSFENINAKKKIFIKGSDTIGAVLMPRLVAEYKNAGNDITFDIEDEGSSSAFTSLIKGTADIGMSSRKISNREIKKFIASGKKIQENVAGVDFIGVIVNKSNPLKNIKLSDISKIFTGKITNWKELGLSDNKISVYTRNHHSGTYKCFQELALNNKEYVHNSQKIMANRDLIKEVENDLFGIGYVSLSSVVNDKIKVLTVDNITPNKNNIVEYEITRILYYYVTDEATAEVKQFLGWLLNSKKAKAIVSKLGFMAPLTKNQK